MLSVFFRGISRSGIPGDRIAGVGGEATAVRPDVRDRVYRINPNLALFVRDDFLLYIQGIYDEAAAGGLEALKTRFYGEGTAERAHVDTLAQDVETVIIKPMLYLIVILLAAEGQRWQSFSNGSLNAASNDWGFVIKDDHLRDYITYAIEDPEADPFANIPGAGSILRGIS